MPWSSSAGEIVSERGGAAHVGDSNQRTLAPEEERSGETGFAESDDQYLFAFEFHAHKFRRRPRPTGNAAQSRLPQLSAGQAIVARLKLWLSQFEGGEC